MKAGEGVVLQYIGNLYMMKLYIGCMKNGGEKWEHGDQNYIKMI